MSNSKNFDGLKFEDFKRLAKNEKLSKYERIGFPDDYRSGYEEEIFLDIITKVSNLNLEKKKILDIGPGCSDLPTFLVDHCAARHHRLYFVDNKEMLDLLPNKDFISKVDAQYPNCPELINELNGNVDVVICYSVLQYIFVEIPFYSFLDQTLSLLAPKGQLLLGDIPNISKRKRFFESESGVRFHKDFMKTNQAPKVKHNKIEHDQIDDSIVFAIMQRARTQGFDSFLLPQPPNLPMQNRREDILIVRP